MRPQEVVISMGEISSGSWAFEFGFVWCFLLFACALFRRTKMAGSQCVGQRKVRASRLRQQKEKRTGSKRRACHDGDP